MFDRFRQRSLELEHLDKGDYTPEEYEGCIVELQRVNRWLGDASALRNSLLAEIDSLNLRTFSVVDIGAGSGELLRVIAAWARKTRRRVQLTGVELNARSAKAIAEQSQHFPEITAIRADAFRLPFSEGQFDFAICSLFTHHFKDGDVVFLLREFSRVASRGIFVIDLHRQPVAYFFFTTIGRLFLHNRLIREDGALSILRSFIPEELERLAHRAELRDIKVTRHFPSRLVLAASPSTSAGALSGSPQLSAEMIAASGSGCASVAASPPCSAERLRLSVSANRPRRLCLRRLEAQPRVTKAHARKGRAFPHCTAAEPRFTHGKLFWFQAAGQIEPRRRQSRD
ncbi:MAG: methyltransferase domain-containing protein [Pyrinomonadaceae bacterium]